MGVAEKSCCEEWGDIKGSEELEVRFCEVPGIFPSTSQNLFTCKLTSELVTGLWILPEDMRHLGNRQRMVYNSWHSKLHMPLWACILSPSHQISGDDTGRLKWMPPHAVCCIMGGTKFRACDFYSNWKKAWYLSRGRHHLILQGFWQQTQLWEMTQVKNTRTMHFWHISQECAGVLRDHGKLTLPTQGTFS